MQNSITPDTIIQRNESRFLASALGDETVMMDIENGDYLGINSVGTDIWELLKHPVTVKDLFNQIADLYEVSETQLTSEVNSFLQKMLEQNMLQVITP